ncbi:MAG: GNAT family N-acetyltransferase [Cyanobacteria bacterium P01_A01_bin.116]
MTKIHELETTRLRLRQWIDADKVPFAQLNADVRVMEFFPNTLSKLRSDAVATQIQHAIAQNGWGFWAVDVKGKHPFIGMVGLNRPAYELPFGPCVEVGWRLGYPYWGHGYATEAAKAAIAFGFETLNLEEIVSFTALVNVRSQAVMERLGMMRSPNTFNHPSVKKGSLLEEHCLYTLTQKDWQPVTERPLKNV